MSPKWNGPSDVSVIVINIPPKILPLPKMNQSPPIIAADDIAALHQDTDSSFLRDGEPRASYSHSHGQTQPHEIAADLPPPHRFIRKAGTRVKFGDATLPQSSPEYFKFLSSYRQATLRQHCEHSISKRTVEMPKIASGIVAPSPPYE